MKKHLFFVGKKFKFNAPLHRYILRKIEEKIAHVDSIHYFNDSDTNLFLQLEQILNSECQLLIVTTKTSFSVVGKLLSTITQDNQVLQENMLIPSQTTLYENETYLLEHEGSLINVLQASEGEYLPQILLGDDHPNAIVHIFEEDTPSASALLEPLAQTYEVKLDFTQIVDGWLTLNIDSNRYGNISKFIDSAQQLMARNIISAANIPAFIIETLRSHNKKVSFAESCTGGLLAAKFTQISGASNVFDGSLVTYSNQLKSAWLAVEDETLETVGAVSSKVVAQMSEGALNVSYADYAISVSGIAGPDGGSDEKPVGTVYVSVRSKTQEMTQHLVLRGDRNYVQEQSANHAIKMLLLIDKELFFKNI